MMPLPVGPFGCIVADPPWRFADTAARGAAQKHYNTMSVEEICRMEVASIAAPTSFLFLWTTDTHLLDGSALLVCRFWDFVPLQIFTWLKEKDGKLQMGAGHYLRHCTEHGILARRQPKRSPSAGPSAASQVKDRSLLAAFWAKLGRPEVQGSEVPSADPVIPDNLIRAPRSEHSAKPDQLYRIAEQLCPGPYLELFARRERPGWAIWGDEAPKSI